MSRSLLRLVMCAALGLIAVVVPTSAATAVGHGTFTRITSPSHDLTLSIAIGKSNSFHVSGQSSLDVTAVDIMCITFLTGQQPDISTLATSVPVSSGQFSVTAVYPSNPPTNCRLRAIPSGVDPSTDYLGAYTGPILYTDAFGIIKASSVAWSFVAYAEEGDGVGLVADAGSCGTQALATIEAPQMVAGPLLNGCGFALPPSNVTASGTPTASAVQVGGHNAYLPSGVHNYLIGTRSLTVTQPALTVTRGVARNGDVTITERATFMRCANGDTYPPTTSSCPSLVSTGVSFQRTTEIFRNGHQARLRDTFVSLDHHAHPVSLQYLVVEQNETAGGTATTGSVGYIYPGHGAAFRAAKLGQSVTHLGSKAGTVLVRSDLYARSDDPQADTLAYTWSRGPSSIRYDASTSDVWGMSYALTVPARSAASLGFALSERWATADVKPLAQTAVADMMSAPTITSPRSGAKVHGRSTAVHGRLAAGANGLPTSVTVNGHKAKITRINSTTATYVVTFTESLGRHVLTATAMDAAGNTRSTAIRITNT